MTVEVYANQPQTVVLTGGGDVPSPGTSQVWTVASSASFPAASAGVTQFHVADLTIGKTTEMIAVTNVSGNMWTVTRGSESSAPVAHSAGFRVTQVVTAGVLSNLAMTPVITTQNLSASTSQFTAAKIVSLLSVTFTAAGRLRLYNNSADRTADQSRPAGTLPTVTGILYEYNADTSNSDLESVSLYVGSGAVIYWQLDGGPAVTLTWVQEPGK